MHVHSAVRREVTRSEDVNKRLRRPLSPERRWEGCKATRQRGLDACSATFGP
jgi:hypothetical protein